MFLLFAILRVVLAVRLRLRGTVEMAVMVRVVVVVVGAVVQSAQTIQARAVTAAQGSA